MLALTFLFLAECALQLADEAYVLWQRRPVRG